MLRRDSLQQAVQRRRVLAGEDRQQAPRLGEGDPIGGGGDFEEVAAPRSSGCSPSRASVLTILTGEGAPALNGLLERIAAAHPELEVEVQEGGQPHYHLLLSAE